jgi:hypothetical protein
LINNLKIYHFETFGETPITEFSVEGDIMRINSDYIIVTLQDVPSTRVIEWKKVG